MQMITLFSSAQALYNQMIEEGVAKECARMVLPLCTPTRLYMTGSCRSWIHYIDLRFCTWNTEGTHGHCRSMS